MRIGFPQVLLDSLGLWLFSNIWKSKIFLCNKAPYFRLYARIGLYATISLYARKLFSSA